MLLFDIMIEKQKKQQTALKTIGETASVLGLEQHVLRFWEKKFSHIKPVKSRGRRYYRPEDIENISEIKHLLYDKGLTIKGAISYLNDKKHQKKQDTELDTALISPKVSTELEAIRQKLETARHDLAKLIID